MKIAIDIADAVAAALSILPLPVHRRVLADFELAELKTPTVTVVPKSVQIANLTRSSTGFDVSVDIGVLQKIGKDTEAEVPGLSELVSSIVSYLNRNPLTAYPDARFKSIVNEPVYAPEMLHEKRVFLSVVTVTYTVVE